MNNTKHIKTVWFYSNLAFVINYALTVTGTFVYLPIPCFPSLFNNLCLIVSYSATVIDLFRNIKSPGFSFKRIYSNQNLICIGLFICLVPNILLLPFFLLSVYHINGDILARRKDFENYVFYDFCILIGRNASSIGRTAIYVEILLIPVSLILVLFKRLRTLPFIIYCVIVRQQYIKNPSVKSVFEEIVLKFDGLVSHLPVSVEAYYKAFKESVGKYNKPEVCPSKKE